MKPKPKRQGPLKIPVKFDEAIKLSLRVPPPPEGWVEYEKRLRPQREKRRSKVSN